MKGRVTVLGHHQGAEISALLVDGKLDDVFYEPAQGYRPGTILRAVADRPMKGMGGMMLRLPDGQGFLRKSKGLAPGQVLTVQVSGYAEPGKAQPVTERLLFKSRFAIVTPDAPGLNISRRIRDDDERDTLLELAHELMEGCDYGLILRSQASGADETAIADDILAMRNVAEQILADTTPTSELLIEGDSPHVLAWREWESDDVQEGADAMDHLVLDHLAEASGAEVPLSSGSMFIEPTRALVAVDVNTGGDLNPAAALRANLACAADLPRQLRLRGLAGQITVDFAPMTKRDRKPIETALRAACRACAVETEFLGWTPLGHAELKRKRERAPIPRGFA